MQKRSWHYKRLAAQEQMKHRLVHMRLFKFGVQGQFLCGPGA